VYDIGDLVIYGSMGVCRVEDIGSPSVGACDTTKTYYTLSRIYKPGQIYTPTDTHTSMRPVISGEEAHSLIESILDIDESIFEAREKSLVKQHYKGLLNSHDVVDLVHVIRSLYLKQQALADKGKPLGQVEAQYMRQAEEMLYDELAIALNVAREEVKGYVEDAVESIQRRAVQALEADLTAN